MCMSGRGGDGSQRGGAAGKTCVDCKKYSRKTFYCTKERRVTAEGKVACVFFVPRHQGKSNRIGRAPRRD